MKFSLKCKAKDLKLRIAELKEQIEEELNDSDDTRPLRIRL